MTTTTTSDDTTGTPHQESKPDTVWASFEVDGHRSDRLVSTAWALGEVLLALEKEKKDEPRLSWVVSTNWPCVDGEVLVYLKPEDGSRDKRPLRVATIVAEEGTDDYEAEYEVQSHEIILWRDEDAEAAASLAARVAARKLSKAREAQIDEMAASLSKARRR